MVILKSFRICLVFLLFQIAIFISIIADINVCVHMIYNIRIHFNIFIIEFDRSRSNKSGIHVPVLARLWVFFEFGKVRQPNFDMRLIKLEPQLDNKKLFLNSSGHRIIYLSLNTSYNRIHNSFYSFGFLCGLLFVSILNEFPLFPYLV